MANKLLITAWENQDPIWNDQNPKKKVITIFDESGNVIHDWDLEWSHSNSGRYEGDLPSPYFISAKADGSIYMSIVQAAYLHGTTLAGIPGEFRIYNREGSRVATTINHNGALISSFVFDNAGNIIVTGQPVNDAGDLYYYIYPADPALRTGYYTTRKFNIGGAEQWKIESWAYWYSSAKMAVTSSNDVVIAFTTRHLDEDTTKKRLIKISGSDGSTVWQTDYTYGANWWERVAFAAVAIDGSGNIYTVGNAENDPDYAFVYKFNSSGTFVAVSSKIQYDINMGFHYGADGYLWSIGNYAVKINTSSLSVISSIRLYGNLGARDGEGYILSARDYSIVNYLAPDFTDYADNVFQASYFQGSESYAPKQRGAFIVENAQLPALKIPLGLAVPTLIGDLYATVSGLAMRIALRAPTWLREFVGAYPPATVYRMYLTGGTGTIELPLSSFSCRRGNGQLRLSAVCPALTPDQITDIEDRSAGEIVIKTGPKFSDGTEQLDEMLRAHFASLRWDSGSKSASGTIDATATAIAENQKTRTLKGISYRNTANGLRRVRCAVDTYLAPGDIADLGAGETLVVAEIIYQVSPEQASMEIAEDGT